MKVLVAAWVGSTNLGDELVFAALARQLAGLGAEVTAISIDPAATRAIHGVGAVDHRNLAALVLAARRADLVVFGGGGLVQDQTSRFNTPYHLSRLLAARAVRTPVAVVGVGAGPLETRLARSLTRLALAPAPAVTTRDEASAGVLRGLGLGPVTVAADLALSLPVPEVATADELVVALRPWRGRRRALPVAAGGQQAPPWFVAGMASALDVVAEATGLGVRVVALQADRDGPVHDQVAERVRTSATTSCPGVEEVVAEVARGRVVVAMRYHALVAAVLGARPSVALGYSPKVDALAADVGAGAVVLPWTPTGLAGLPGAVAKAVVSEARSGSAMAEARQRLRRREQANGDILDRLLRP